MGTHRRQNTLSHMSLSIGLLPIISLEDGFIMSFFRATSRLSDVPVRPVAR
jgi:hypothetical protein